MPLPRWHAHRCETRELQKIVPSSECGRMLRVRKESPLEKRILQLSEELKKVRAQVPTPLTQPDNLGKMSVGPWKGQSCLSTSKTKFVMFYRFCGG